MNHSIDNLSNCPLVSCIMPTRDRRAFVPHAIACFQHQTYTNCELIIVDDGPDPIADLVPKDQRIRYIYRESISNVGAKRNRACEMAQGQIIAHWDDDDWYAPTRLQRQVQALETSDAQLVGVSALRYYDLTTERAFEYRQQNARRPWLSLLLYRKALWLRHKHPNNRVGSDTVFLRSLPRGSCTVMQGLELCVCFIHGRNLSPKRLSRPRWQQVPRETVTAMIGENWIWYQKSADRSADKGDGKRPVDSQDPERKCDVYSASHTAINCPDDKLSASRINKKDKVRWEVVVFTYERPMQLLALLGDLGREQEAGIDLRVRVYDDASTASMNEIKKVIISRNWRLKRANHRYGKEAFWKWVSQAYADLKDTRSNSMFAFLPDDCRLAADFFERALFLWRTISDPRKRTLTVLVDALRENASCWTGFEPRRAGAVWQTQWVDGAFIADYSYLKALGFAVPAVTSRWWKRGPRVSSGVGRAVSTKLHVAGDGMYRTDESLVMHLSGPSNMHPWMPHDRLATVRFVGDARFDNTPVAEERQVSEQISNKRPSWITTIMTYNRPALLTDLLRDLIRESEGHTDLQVHVFDDASTEDYSGPLALINQQGWVYVRAKKHHGKRGFHRWVTRSWSALRGVDASTMLAFLPDDCRLCRDFFNRAYSLYQRTPAKRRACLNVLIDGSRQREACWTNTFPSNADPVDRTQWVDGAFIANRTFLEALDFRVPAVDLGRWNAQPNRSSGVGESISRTLHANGYQMYRVRQSLIVHVDGPSQMNGCLRDREPLIAVDFIDGAGAHRRLRERIPVYASMATIPSRERELKLAVDSLLPQVDVLRVYLNGYQQVPAFLGDSRIEIALSQDHGDRGDAGKFFWCEDAEGYQFVCDDDIIYPPDMVATMINKIEQHGRRAVVGLHGVILRNRCQSYYRDRKVLHCSQSLSADQLVHILGTSSAAWHASTIQLKRSDFRKPNMADIWLGIVCQTQRVPMLAIERRAGWLRILEVNDTIFDRYRRRDATQTAAVAEIKSWQLFDPAKDRKFRANDNSAQVSVLIPVAYERGFLHEALVSVAAQTGIHLSEVVVINDGCAAIDQTRVAALWKRQSPLRYLEHLERRGQSAALNRGFELCQGEFVAVLHDDDIMLQGKLEQLSRQLRNHRVHAVAYSLPRYIGKAGQRLSTPRQYEIFLNEHKIVRWKDVLPNGGLMIHGGTTLYRCDAIREVGGWDESLDTAEEWELHLRLLKAGFSFIAVPYVTTGYRIHENNKSATYIGHRHSQIKYIREKLEIGQAAY